MVRKYGNDLRGITRPPTRGGSGGEERKMEPARRPGDAPDFSRLPFFGFDTHQRFLSLCAVGLGKILAAHAPPAHCGSAHAQLSPFCLGPTRLAANGVKPFFSMGG